MGTGLSWNNNVISLRSVNAYEPAVAKDRVEGLLSSSVVFYSVDRPNVCGASANTNY
jgi:hypothetical protein